MEKTRSRSINSIDANLVLSNVRRSIPLQSQLAPVRQNELCPLFSDRREPQVKKKKSLLCFPPHASSLWSASDQRIPQATAHLHPANKKPRSLLSCLTIASSTSLFKRRKLHIHASSLPRANLGWSKGAPPPHKRTAHSKSLQQQGRVISSLVRHLI
ncbi:hypothetical protein MA16_Dca007362 [Dendrobium catenatum]|uniref:Uncharacterized protein n=1 Tax=Dendrobium catenatum TaxID=906689 RepID=A0A2I0W8K1_9ASPA|nr:hypothetical protein MA16_Dca007362 [Dendrobium catenatum]